MVQVEVLEGLVTIRESIQARAVERFQVAAIAAAGRMQMRGVYASSMHLQAIEAAAADEFESAAQEFVRSLLDVIEKAPVVEPKVCADQVEIFLRAELENLAAGLDAAGSKRTGQIGQRLVGRWGSTDLSSRKVSVTGHLVARARIAALQARLPTEAGSHSLSVAGSGNVVQFGAGSTATVTQIAQGSPDLRAAIDALTAAVSQARELKEVERAEALEVIQEMRTESEKERPNRTKFSALLEGVKKTCEVVSAAGPALVQIQTWWKAWS